MYICIYIKIHNLFHLSGQVFRSSDTILRKICIQIFVASVSANDNLQIHKYIHMYICIYNIDVYARYNLIARLHRRTHTEPKAKLC